MVNMDGAAVVDTAHVPTRLSREQILEQTSKSLRELGYDKTTIRQIAKMLGCAVGSIYRYYKDKRELLFAVTQQSLEPVVVLMDAGSPFEATARLYYQQATEDQAVYRLMFWLASVGAGDGPIPPIVQRIIDGWSKELGDSAIAKQCWSVLHGSITLEQEQDEVLPLLLILMAKAGVMAAEAESELPVQVETITRVSPATHATVPESLNRPSLVPDAPVVVEAKAELTGDDVAML